MRASEAKERAAQVRADLAANRTTHIDEYDLPKVMQEIDRCVNTGACYTLFNLVRTSQLGIRFDDALAERLRQLGYTAHCYDRMLNEWEVGWT